MSFVESTSSASQIIRRVSLRSQKQLDCKRKLAYFLTLDCKRKLSCFFCCGHVVGASSLAIRWDQIDSLWLDDTIDEAALSCSNWRRECCLVALRSICKLFR
eukprot:COSAG02_NODE_4416_length_5383_cov_2.963475_1_plen_102_part_00